MGVPAFYKWLAEKYPKIVQELLERRMTVVDGVAIPLNLNEPNPNGVEYDNLYIDMNGLIHPCSHPEDREAPSSEHEMYVNVTKYVDRLFAGIRPRKLLFLAIDGVAPRAKMNQQRSRRFRAAQDAKERAEATQEVIEEMLAMGLVPPASKGPEWDSNVITPGTEFMSDLSTYLRFYVQQKMNTDPAWRNIKVILSDASVPGEGEHKIMSFIRHQRTQPGYDPNQRHVLHGLDADLIMLALATHEAHFTILREEVTFGGRGKHQKSDAQRMLEELNRSEGAAISSLRPEDEWVYGKPLQRLNIAVLREYLAGEFELLSRDHKLPFEYDLERVIDDFVFLCFFVGNDFLPHLPSLDIRDGAIDFLIESYKDLLPSMGGYITSPGGVVNLGQVDIILGRVGQVEDMVFQRKKAKEDADEERKKRNNARNRAGGYAKFSANALVDNIRNNTVAVNSAYAQKDAAKLTFIPLGAPPPPPGPPPPAPSNAAAAQLLRAKMAGTTGAATAATTTSRVLNEFGNETMSVETDATLVDIPAKLILGKRDSSDMSISEEGVDIAPGVKVSKRSEDDDVTKNTEIVSDIAVAVMGEDDLLGAPEMMETDSDDDGDVGDIALGLAEIAKEAKKASLMPHYKQFMDGDIARDAKDIVKNRLKAKQIELLEKQKSTVKDDIRFHESGWKDRYYGDPFKKKDLEQGGGLQNMCYHYIKGLCWVFKYYYEGCVSWNWFYPFHYAPFASDLVNVDTFHIEFDLSVPFHPFEQLLAVLPSESAHCLPTACSWLMTDRESPIIDIYNSDIPIDPNGKPLPWLWVLLIPFIEEERVRAAMSTCQKKLTDEERLRNSWGPVVIFLHKDSKIGSFALSKIEYAARSESSTAVYLTGDDKIDAVLKLQMNNATTSGGSNGDSDTDKDDVFFTCETGDGICGWLSPPPPRWYADLETVIRAPARPHGAFMDIPYNAVLSFVFRGPSVQTHISKLLEGVVHDESFLTAQDLLPRRGQRVGRGQINIVDIAQSTRPTENLVGRENLYSYQGYGGDQYGRSSSSSYATGLAASQRMIQGNLPRSYEDARGRGGEHGSESYRGSYNSEPALSTYDQFMGARGPRADMSYSQYDAYRSYPPATGSGHSNYGGRPYDGGGRSSGYNSYNNRPTSSAPTYHADSYSGYQYSGYESNHAPQSDRYQSTGQFPHPDVYASRGGFSSGRGANVGTTSYSSGYADSAPSYRQERYDGRGVGTGGGRSTYFSHSENLSRREPAADNYASYSKYGRGTQYGGTERTDYNGGSSTEYSGSRYSRDSSNQVHNGGRGRGYHPATSAPPPNPQLAPVPLSVLSGQLNQAPSGTHGAGSVPPLGRGGPPHSRDPRLRR